MPSICSPSQIEKAGAIRAMLAAYVKSEDLIRIGAYKPGSDAMLDKAVASLPTVNAFLQQNPAELPELPQTLERMAALPS